MSPSVFKKLVTKLNDTMYDPFLSVQPMPLRSLIVSGVESADQLAHADTSNAPAPPRPLPVRPLKIGVPPLHLGPSDLVRPEHSGGNGLGGLPGGEVGGGPPQPRGGSRHGQHRHVLLKSPPKFVEQRVSGRGPRKVAFHIMRHAFCWGFNG